MCFIYIFTKYYSFWPSNVLAFQYFCYFSKINVIDMKITFCILHIEILTSYILVYILGYHAPYIFMMLGYYYYYYTTLTYSHVEITYILCCGWYVCFGDWVDWTSFGGTCIYKIRDYIISNFFYIFGKKSNI
jgi:hypothetical protein